MATITAITANRSSDSLLVDAADLRLAYGRKIVLDAVTLQIRRGEFWFFVGTNGAGKSTLLKAILGTLSPQAGRIRSLAGAGGIGFVPQRCNFNASLPTTVREFVLFGLVGIRADRAERRRRLEWALQQVDLQDKEDRDYWSLSGGQQQRALVARALARRPRLLLADEPTNGLDLLAHNTLLDAVAELHCQEQLALVMIAHDLMLAARYSTHVALFHDGTVLAGPTGSVFQPANLEKIYRLPLDLCEKLAGLATDRGAADGQL